MSDVFSIISVLLLGLAFLGIYFLPSICAFSNKKKNAVAVGLLNLFTGWTVIGWLISLIWGVCKD